MLRRLAAAVPLLPLGVLVALAACADAPPPTAPMASAASAAQAGGPPTAAQRLMHDYVAAGTSIAAGFISGGMSAETQRLAYPVLLAEAAGVPFEIPLLAAPGCPVPFVGPLAPAPGSATCAGRADQRPVPVQNTVAVPGQTLAEALTPGASAPLGPLLVGDLSQVEAMRRANPTFVSVHLGDNDAVRAALSGSLAPLTPLASFTASYAEIVAAVRALPRLRGALLVGVFDPVVAAPILQPGAYFFASRDAAGRFNGVPVNPNCSPVTALGQPNPLAANLVSFQMVTAGFGEINCDPQAYPVGDPRRGALLLDAAEQVAVRTRVAEFNAVIQAAAAAEGWAYYDPNPTIAAALAARTNGQANEIRRCQGLATAATAAQFQAAVLTTCPVTGPFGAPNFFGALISFDGLHPSAVGHARLAAAMGPVIDARYGTTLAF